MREINETWTLGGVAITVENDSLDYPIVRMGRLEPLEHNYSVGHKMVFPYFSPLFIKKF